MFSASKNYNYKRLLVVLCALAIMVNAHAQQVSQTVTVLPPYSNKLSDYIASPGKINSIITVQSADNPKFEIYLRGTITSADESIIVKTRTDYKPSAPIVINAIQTPSGALIFQPYALTYSDILRIFDEQRLEYKGISRAQVMQEGLPEGIYNICFNLIDYRSDEYLLSSCSNPFTVMSVEAPLIIQPQNNIVLRGYETQNVVFSWTRPPNAPLTTQYKLKIIELGSPNENYQDKIRSEGYPFFFETSVNSNVYLYSAANPQLRPGKSYAFVVQAVDPTGKTPFKNKGYSEVNLFSCITDEQKPMSGSLPPGKEPQAPGFPNLSKITPPSFMPSKLKGTLKYSYHDDDKKITYPMSNAKIRLVTKYIVKYADGTINEIMSRQKEFGQYIDGKEIAVATTDDKGNFSFAFLSGSNGEALKDTDCSEKIAQYNGTGSEDKILLADWPFDSPRGGPNPGNSAISSVSESHGNNTCKLYLAYAIEIQGEHARYYLNPDQDWTYFFEVKAGETKDVGEITSWVKSVNLKVTVKSLSNDASTINSDLTLPDMDVYVYRKINFDYPPVFPEYDVTPEKTDNFPAPKVQGMHDMFCVGKGLTNKDGIAEIKSLVLSDHPAYQYYIYIRNDKGNYNYESDAARLVDLKALIDNMPGDLVNSHPYGELLKVKSASSFFLGEAPGSNHRPVKMIVSMPAKFPTLRIILTEEAGNKKIDNPQTQVTLKEEYKAGNYIFKPDQTGVFDVGQLLITDETRYTTFCFKDAGIYELKYLPVEMKWKQGEEREIVGPKRTVTVKSLGFADTTFTVKGKPLYYGEKYEMAVLMRYGARFEGAVYEGGTNKPLSGASINVLGETAKSTTTGNDGKFRMELRKLNTPRKIVISKDGYMPDTVTTTIDKEENIRNFELFKKARRLRVEVWSNGHRKEGIVVTLPDVLVGSKVQPKLIQSPQPGSKQVPITSGVLVHKMAAVSARSTPFEWKKYKTGLINSIIIDATKNKEPYSLVTTDDGYVDFEFVSGSEEHNDFKVVISNHPESQENYPATIRTVTIPYSGELMGTLLQVDLPEGGCLSGKVYLGETNNEPLEGIDVTATIQEGDYTIKAKTDAYGNYTLRNLPVDKPFKLQFSTNKTGTNYVGHHDNHYLLTKKGADCHIEDFHMKTVEGVDVSTLMGFPLAVSGWKEQPDGSYLLTGTITLPSNTHFKEQTIDIAAVSVRKSTVQNNAGNFLLIPSTLPFVTDKNNITVEMDDYKVILADGASGLKFDLRDNHPAQGEMQATVQIYGNDTGLSANFGGYGYSLPDLYLTRDPGSTNMRMTVFKSEGTISAPNGNNFYLSDGVNQSLTYSIDGFPNKAVAQPDKSFFNKSGGLTLQTRLKAAIATLNPSNFEIDAGAIRVSKNGITTSNPQPFDVKMGQWTLRCQQWAITNEGVKVSDATLSTGVDVRIENLRFTSSSLETSEATVHLDKLKLLGIKDVNIATNNKGLTYKYLHGGVSGWSLYATPTAGQTTVATLQGLPGVHPADRVEFISVDLNSEGESYFVLNSRKFRLFDIVDFTPFPSTYMYVTTSSLKLMGTYDFGIPEYERPGGAMGFYKEGNNLAFKMMDMEAFAFTRHNVRYDLTRDYILSDKLFIAKGTVHEPGNLPSLNVTMRHTPQSTRIDLDPGQKLPMGEGGKELANLVGGIQVVNKAWDTFRFEGDMKGMGSMTTGQKMNFEVKGAVQATGQEIRVNGIPSFPGLSITYDMSNARFIGSADLSMNLSGLLLQGNVTTLMDSRGWLFNASGIIEIPGIGGANLYGLFGNYMDMPPEVSSKIGDAICLPAGFKTNLNGFFLSAGLTKQILPKISYNLGIVSVYAGVDVSVNARAYMLFGQGTTFGMGVLAEGHAYLGGSSAVTCTSVNADAKLQCGISGDYNTQTRQFNIDGCASVGLVLSASQCVPLLVGCGSCVSVSLPTFTIGTALHLDNHSGFSMELITHSCDEQCE
ncbi:TANFOR domain-containing protein [Proteiniphilum sp.]|uniref:TANFOR domain-containing protein n=1 Tax=Proteiniphilum sp. TaxID=1926877 RepID=UPI002B20A880|nr:TANFOR domain-containing protein [Proteiniphilum sp.]MEA4918702.1 TANFOR domain-containing protein [Proteiniphilum sp.]